MKKKHLLLLSFIMVGIIGCSDENTNSIEYYKKHKEERAQKIEECKEPLNQLSETTNCKNALSAQISESAKTITDNAENWLNGTDKEEIHSIDFYKENREDRLNRIQMCKDNPSQLLQTENCKNAFAAHASEEATDLTNKAQEWIEKNI